MIGENDKPEFNRDIFLYNDKNGNPIGFNQSLFASQLINKYHIKTIRENEQILYYKDGYYHYNGESVIKEKCEEIFADIITKRKISEVIGHVQRKSYIDRDKINNNPQILNLENGLFNIETEKFTEHTPEKIITVRIPIKYNPGAKCPKIESFISEIVEEENILVLEEIAGFCLYRRYIIKKSFMFVGSGDNGKSIYLAILTILLGKGNYSAIPLQRLSTDRFSTSFLCDKMANIYADLSSQALKDTGTFKMLTGGDPIPAEIKGGKLFTFINYAKLLFSANTIPDTDDSTDAYMGRWIIINFPYKFVNKARNNINEKQKIDEETLLNRLTTPEEMSGLLNLSLKGLKRILTNRKFSYNKSNNDIREEYKRLSNPIYGFVKDYCIPDSTSQIPKSVLYNIYVEYCKEKKQPAEDISKFGRELPKVISLIESRPSTEQGKQIVAWKGIKLKHNIYNRYNRYFYYVGFRNKNIYKYKEKIGNTTNTNNEEITELEVEGICKKCGVKTWLIDELCSKCRGEEK